MKIKRRIKIISHTERTFTQTINKKPPTFFCRDCGKQVMSLSINEATRFSRKSWREIVRMIELSEIHSSETADGEIYICADSILKDDRVTM